MANLTYRASSTPTLPEATTVKDDPLTNLEVDANFKALDNDVTNKVSLGGNVQETITGVKTFSNVVILSTQASQVTHAVRAEREISAGDGLSGGGNLTANRTISLTSISAGSATVGAVRYNGNTKAVGQFYGGISDPDATTRLNYDGLLRATRLQSVSLGVNESAPDTAGAIAATSIVLSGSVRGDSLGVGTAASGTAGEIRATNNITAYYSDDRLKTRLGNIENALDKVCMLSGFYYEANDVAQSLGYDKIREVGVSAQQVQAVLPEVVVPAPIDDKYLTVRYEKIIPLLIEAIKELKQEIKSLKGE